MTVSIETILDNALSQLQAILDATDGLDGGAKEKSDFIKSVKALEDEGVDIDTINELILAATEKPLRRARFDAAVEMVKSEHGSEKSMGRVMDACGALKRIAAVAKSKLAKGAWGVGYSSSPFKPSPVDSGAAAPQPGQIVIRFSVDKSYVPGEGATYEVASREYTPTEGLALIQAVVKAVMKAQGTGLAKSIGAAPFSVEVETDKPLRKADGDDEPLAKVISRRAANPSSSRDVRATGIFAGR